jgi:hypothetical protein
MEFNFTYFRVKRNRRVIAGLFTRYFRRIPSTTGLARRKNETKFRLTRPTLSAQA